MRKPNPKLIGGFVTLALIAAAALVMTLGTSSFFGQTGRYLLFFDHSVNGLQVGSAVKFRGVPVGTVAQVAIRHPGQREDSTAIPVVISIDLTRLERDLGLEASILSPEAIQRSLERGLAAQLSLESFITGQQFVELDFMPEREVTRHLAREGDIVEIPTIPSSTDQITNDLAGIISNLEQVDFGRLNENFNRILEGAADALETIHFADLNQLLVDILQDVRKFIDSGDMNEALAAVTTAAIRIDIVAQDIGEVIDSYDADAFGEELKELATTARNTLERIDDLAALGNDFLSPQSESRIELEQTLRDWSSAARSLRSFIQYLERNPRSLLSGRDKNPFQPE
ncbi:MAG: MCE family protein [Opitutales bacterium]|nr:MCE family protein [Opitutales bacterium]